MRHVLSPGACLALGMAAAVPVALAAKAPAKAADAAPAAKAPQAAAAPAPKAPADLPLRVIEKKDGDYIYKVTLRPGNLKPNRVADVQVELYRALDVPDPVNGDRKPLAQSNPVATVQPPDAPPVKGKKAAPAQPEKYVLWPNGDPGHFVFHFTPPTDGLYQVTIAGTEQPSDDNNNTEPTTFSTNFRIGAGTAAGDTEISQGVASRHASRHPVDNEDEGGTSKLQKVMAEIGQRYLDLENSLKHPPAKGPQTDAAAEARAIAALFAQVKGHVPSDHQSDGGEFDKLADDISTQLEEVASAAGEKDRAAPRAALSKVELQGCNQCHTKYWYNVTDDLSSWPSFHQKTAHAAE